MKKFILSILAATSCFFWYSCRQAQESMQETKDAIIQSSLEKEAEEFNKTGGKTLDSDTRMDSMSVAKGKVVTYYYTLLQYEKKDVDTVRLKKILKKEIGKDLNTNKDFELARQNKVSFRYHYYDKNGQYTFRVNFIAKDSIGD